MTDVELTGAGETATEALPTVVTTLTEAPAEAEVSPALLRIGCVMGVQPDKWQRRWQENRPDVPTSWEFVDSAVQWEGLRTGRWSIVLVRTNVDRSTDGAEDAEVPLPLELLSYGAADLRFPADLVERTHVVELYPERWAVLGRKKHDIGLVSEVTLADLADLPDKRIGRGELVIPVGEPQLALTYAASGTGIAILPETLAKVAGHFEGTIRPLVMDAATRVCAVWLKDRPADCPEELIQEFIGMLRGRRAQSSRTGGTSADAAAAARKQVRREKIKSNRVHSQEQRRQRIAARHAAKRAAQKRGKRR
ncbi:LysR family transcriptional regulator substrate-binding protein [Lawsonella clevelandensis]|uniref:LysR family transcriptional regulator substrate-binding protein n=1 Tax=Lawsonella clevelandensis TaxID=1528099 RepID=UPI0011DD6B00|nr:LysR family transcriptional regulator substrate-binding protein [Lawsonella clevelandensis]MDU7192849.1 LysR family transcriptional regulator substrate-binding protein [Lawsonella clevelandensis]